MNTTGNLETLCQELATTPGHRHERCLSEFAAQLLAQQSGFEPASSAARTVENQAQVVGRSITNRALDDGGREKRLSVDIRNLKTTELEIRERLNGLERDWLIGRLVSKTGVRTATYSHADPHRLTIEYDADLFNMVELLDFLYLCGLRGRPSPDHTAFA
jgi:hypothetical protein